jgi:hypothetical protein
MAHDTSIREAFEDFIADKEYQGARPTTLLLYRSNWDHFLRDTGVEKLDIAPSRLRRLNRPKRFLEYGPRFTAHVRTRQQAVRRETASRCGRLLAPLAPRRRRT